MKIAIVDTTLRDGQQSLWACNMRVGAMLPAIADIDAAGFDAMEFTAAIMFKRAVKDLHEYPWDWLALGAPLAPNTQLRLHGFAGSRFTPMARSLQDLYARKMHELGIRTTRVSDTWNNFEQVRPDIEFMETNGFRIVLNVIYSISPRHTYDYYVQRFKDAAAMQPYRICFKDVGGLLTPRVARQLFPEVVKHAQGIPVEFHAHSNNGMASYNALLAAEAGIQVIHTAIPPLANGSSQPSVFTVVKNLRERGFEVPLDLEPLERVRDHFDLVADEESLPKGIPAEFDESLYSHQVPGGMISNLRFQLAQIRAADRLDEALREAAAVRRDLGYPIMVTPLSQFVGSQAVLNVLTGERYRTVTDEVIRYALGHWGPDAPREMDPDVRELVLDRPRTKQLSEVEPDETSLDDLRERYGRDLSDDELIVRILSGVGPDHADLGVRQSNPRPTYDDYRAESTSRRIIAMARHTAGTLSFRTNDGELSLTLRKRT